jgi:hypothetical protein
LVLAAWPPLLFTTAMLAPKGLSGGKPAPNPFGGIQGTIGELLNVVLAALFFLFVPLVVGALLAAIVRFARSRGAERQQLKWLAYWAGLFGVVLVSSAIAPSAATTLAVNVGINGLPIAVAIAILRYRLYDIDLLIKRTLVYGATSAAIAASFSAGTIAVQALLRPVTSGDELAVAVSTLLSVALFQPIRGRVQDAVDRRFDRSRYDAARTLDAFADRLRDEVDLDALRAELLDVVGGTMAPAHASLWLRPGIGR